MSKIHVQHVYRNTDNVSQSLEAWLGDNNMSVSHFSFSLCLYWKSAWANAASEVTRTAADENPTAADLGVAVVDEGAVTVAEAGDEPAVELLEAFTSDEVEPVGKEAPFTESVSDALPTLPIAGTVVAGDVPEVLAALAGFGVVLVPGVAAGEDPEGLLEGALVVGVLLVPLGADVPGADVAVGADVGCGVVVVAGEGVPELGAVVGDVHVIAWPVHVWLLLAHVSVGRLATHSIQQISAEPAWSVHVHLDEQSEASVALWP